MCGICGAVMPGCDAPVDRATIARMTDALRHRGPDDDGMWVGPGVGLGFRRLAIVDLEAGEQPLTNEDGNVVLVCNGEIYNAPELRDELLGRGHRFRGRSDVEVIVHLYEELGPDCVDRLRGMFAFALWDRDERRLLLVRDRLGIKPLCYAHAPDGSLWFASEAKALLAADLEVGGLDAVGLAGTLTFGGPLFDRTLLEGVRQVEPGFFLDVREGRIRHKRYWDVSFPVGPMPSRGRREWAEELRETLAETVRIHLRSDVEVGAWLSPGIDSSAVTALAARERAATLHTFSLGFDGAREDELREAPTLDHFAGYDLSGRVVRYRDPGPLAFAREVWALEQPTHLHHALWRLAEGSSDHFKVILTGQGSDENLGGYWWYRADRAATLLSRLPEPLRRIPRLWRAGRWLLDGHGDIGPRWFADRSGGQGGWESVLPLMTEEWKTRLRASVEDDWGMRFPEAYTAWSRFQQLLYVDIKTRLVSFINHGMDRSGMAFSQELRVPFLDHVLVELCARIPDRVKMRRFTEKAVLRDAMQEELPRSIARRKKRGLGSPPIDLRGALAPLTRELLAEKMLREKGYFDPEKVTRLLDAQEGGAGNPTDRRRLRYALGVQLWDEMFVRDRAAVWLGAT